MNQIISYPVPAGAVLQKDYMVKVRPVGEKFWKELSVYRVKVDMHEVRFASMAYFDFEGEAEIEISGPSYIYQVDIRPLSKGITASCDTKKVSFRLNKPADLSIELNQERYHNLHLFAGEIEKNKPNRMEDNTLVIHGDLSGYNSFGGEVAKQLSKLPKGRTLYIEPGIHYIREAVLRLPSDTRVYLEGGCILIGAFICSGVENVHIYGRGIIWQSDFPRYGGINGLRISHSDNIRVEDIIFINPPHYTLYIGGSQDILIRNIKAFSCEGWSDGIDMMSSSKIRIEGGFLRNSDDCIAIYGRRWSYNGNSSDIAVKGLILWADVAHPINIGTHGDYEQEGNVLENISFEDIDILEHNEYQENYLGCMAVNAGDKNTVRNVSFENIRIEPFRHGRIFDLQIKCNPDYNPEPGKQIKHITFENITYTGGGEEASCIRGFNEDYYITDIRLHNILFNGKKMHTLQEANIEAGEHAFNIKID